MSVRRADQEDQPSTSALPPTLFRLPDLDYRPAAPEPESTDVVSGEGDRGSIQDIGEVPAAAGMISSAAANSQTDAYSRESADPADAPTPNHLLPEEQVYGRNTPASSPTSQSEKEPARTNSSVNSVLPSDQPAGRGWMETFGSNRGIAVMLVLVFIAAWWTSPNYDPAANSDSDHLAQADSSLEFGSEDIADSISNDSLMFDLGEQENLAAIEAVNDQPITQAIPSEASPTTQVSVALGTPEPTASFDTNAFGIASRDEPQTPPSLANSQIEAQVVSTKTSENVVGQLEQMAHQGDFGITPNTSAAFDPDRTATPPQSPNPIATQTPSEVDWTRYFPADR